jgi:hypothetical protein
MKEKNQGGMPKTGPTKSALTFVQAATAAGLATQAGKGAVESRYRASICAKLAKTQFTGSIDTDAAFRVTEGQAHRWDYGIGLQPPAKNELAVWVEPHPASSNGEVKVVLAKLAWLKAKLNLPAFKALKALTDECVKQEIRPHHWMASGRVCIRPGSREAHMLARAGLDIPSTKVEI